MIRRILTSMIPAGTRRSEILKKAVKKAGFEPRKHKIHYHDWFKQRESAMSKDDYSDLKETPLLSVVVPCFNTDRYQFEEMVYSVINQFYENWELIVVDASDKDGFSYISESCNIDNRIKVIKTKNEGISKNTNLGIEYAKGDYVSLLDHDDMLTRNALGEVAIAISNNPGAALIYSDEDKVLESKRYFKDPFIKPDFSPELLRNVNYITHFSTIKKDVLEMVGLLDSKTDGAQDYDLFLKIADTGRQVLHIPQVLYHWRTAKNSTANDISTKSYIFESGERALRGHLKRNSWRGHTEAIEGMPGFYKTVFESNSPKSLIIMIGDIPQRQALYLKKMLKTKKHQFFERVYIRKDVYEWLNSSKNVNIPKNFHHYKNIKELEGMLTTKDHTLAIMTSYVSIVDLSKENINELSGIIEQDKNVFSISPLIMNNSNRVANAGYVLDDENLIHKQFLGQKLNDSNYRGYVGWVRSVVCPSLDFFCVRSSTVGEHGIAKLTTPSQHVRIKGEDSRSVLWSHTRMQYQGSSITPSKPSVLEPVYKDEDLVSLPDIALREPV